MNPNPSKKTPPRRWFSGKAVLITGGTSGIGRAAALAFARRGAGVSFCGLDERQGKALEKELAETGVRARFSPADVTSAGAMERLVKETAASFGGLDVAFNNAGVNHPPALAGEIPPKTFERVIAANLAGVFNAMRAELWVMAKRKAGCIINMASILATQPSRWMAAYSASKAAVVSLSQNAAEDYRDTGVRIYAISPGSVDTPMYRRALEEIASRPERYAGGLPKGGRPLSAEEVAEQVLRLAAPETAPQSGTNLVIPGGGDIPFSS